MIAKIGRGQKLGGLMVYLLGEGDANEHEHRHVIAGSPSVMREEWTRDFHGREDRQAARDAGLAIAREIDLPRKLYGTAVKMKAKPVAAGARGRGVDVVERPGKGETGVLRDAPVWHCVLSAMPGEHLTDEVWAQITNTFMDEMGFTATPDAKRAQARWAAVRHGLSGAAGDGQDHIHIAASLVREDGSKVSTFDFGPGKAKGDWPRAEEVCVLLEQRYGLKVRASRKEGGELSGLSRAEIERADRDQAPEPERERLRRMVRAAAVSADSEVAFVHGLREAGISVVPRWAASGQTEVVGYKVRLRHGNTEAGPWLGGGTLAKDLNLNALREQQWNDSARERAAAVAAWMPPKTATRERAARTLDDAELWQQAKLGFEQWHQRLGEIPRSDRARWAWTAGQAAGVFAAWSEKLEGDQPGALAAAAAELTRSAQLPKGEPRYRPTSPEREIGDLAKLLMSAGPSRSDLSGKVHQRAQADATAALSAAVLAALVLLLAAAVAILMEVIRAHRTRGELTRALALQAVGTAHLEPLRQRWEAQSGQRRAHEAAAEAALAREARIVEPAPAPVQDPAQQRPRWMDSERVRKAANAASGPLRPPKRPAPAAAQGKRRFYTEMSEKERSEARQIAESLRYLPLSSGARIKPTMLDDAALEKEIAERRAEIEALTSDLRARGEQGPNARQAVLDNAEMVRRAALIEPALDVESDAAALIEKQRQLQARRIELKRQLGELGARQFLARGKVQKQIEGIDEELLAADPVVSQARADAVAAAERTQTPRHVWEETLRDADPRRQDARVRAAEESDQRGIDEDRSYLAHLQREADRFSDEYKRRTSLPATQRAAEDQARARGQDPGKKSVKKPSKLDPDYTQNFAPPRWDEGPEHDKGRGR